METISLKALSNKVLQRNRQGNLMETVSKNDGNFQGIFEGKSFPVSNGVSGQFPDITADFSRLYREHMKRLSQHDLTADEIEPSRLAEIHRAIERMDKAFLRGDLEDFKNAMNETERLYFEAVEIHKKEVFEDD